MKNFDSLYYEKRLFISWRAQIVVDAILKAFPDLKLVYDIGCSVGEFVEEFKKRGISALGYEISKAVLDHLICSPRDIIFRDWSARYVKGLPPKADLLLFFEVAPFLTEHQQRTMAMNLSRMAKVILTTSEGSCGKYFLEKGMVEDAEASKLVTSDLEKWRGKPAVKSIYHALRCYRKE
jgi:SAM-dependent methyltransferase